MSGASAVSPRQLRDVHIRLSEPPKASEGEKTPTA